jgi:hypothetical protein
MNDDLQRIRRYIGALVRRERMLVLGRVLLQGGLVLFGVLAIATIAASSRWDRSTATAIVVLAAGIGAWAAVVVPLLRSWRPTGDTLRQARIVEQLAPDLRGRLLTAVERVDGPRGSESPAMLGIVAKKAATTAAAVSPARVHPARHLLVIGAATAFAWLVSTIMLLVSPGGPVGTARWWLGGGIAEAAVESVEREAEGDHARVGDLVLRYVYPAYTGLEPHEVANGTGDAHGPPGTIVEVTARAAEPVEAAALVAYDEPALEAKVGEDRRRIEGAFTIGAVEGVWRFLTYQSGEAVPSRDFKIVPEVDLAPEVTVEAASNVLEVAVDQRIGVGWRARDDYGIRKVIVELDGQEIGSPLASPRERKSEIEGQTSPRPSDLGLKAGDRAKLSIVAWDNDEVSGSKKGRSREIEIIVLGASGLDMKEDQRQRELRKLLIAVLADFLEEVYPPGRTSGSYASWGEKVADRYEPLEEWADRAWGERMPRDRREALEYREVKAVNESGGQLIRYTQVAFTPGSPATPKTSDAEVVVSLREEAVGTVENAILLLDYMIQARAEEEIVEKAQKLGDLAVDVQMSLQQEMSAQEMITRLNQLDNALEQLMEAAARLEEGNGLREQVNSRGNELKALEEEVRKALEEGRMAEAKQLMGRLAQQMEELSQAVQDEIERRQQQQRESGESAQELVDELEQLEEDQRALQEQTRQLREKSDASAAEEVEDAWERLEKLSEQHAADGEEYVNDLEGANRPFNERVRAEGAEEASSELRDAIAARDLRTSQRALEEARQSWETAELMYEFLRRSGAAPQGPGRRELDGLFRQLDQMQELLDQLEEKAGEVDPQTQQQVRQMRQKQEELQQRLDEAQAQASKVQRGMRPPPDGMKESLEEAEAAMEQAGQDLGKGQPMPAEGQQGAAADRIREARERLQQSMRDQRSMQQPGKGQGQGGEEGEQPDGPNGEGDQMAPDPVEIPNPEQFKTPEEYRQELLEGMEGDVPEEYRALKKRYYEELVHQ